MPDVAELTYNDTIVEVAIALIGCGVITVKLINCVDVCPVPLSVTTNAYDAVLAATDGLPEITPGEINCKLG